MRSQQDRWIIRVRATVGAGGFGWELIGTQLVGTHPSLWIVLACVWMLGAPIEEIIAFLTSGRLQISVRQRDEEEEEPPPKPPRGKP